MDTIEIKTAPLQASTFKRFGDVIEVGEHTPTYINNGTTKRYHDLSKLDLLENAGRPLLNIFRSLPYEFPVQIKMLERHPLSSQAFVPMSVSPFLVVVAETSDNLMPGRLHAFLTNGHQGVNYHRRTWHHPLLALHAECDFMVIDRAGNEENCEVFSFENFYLIN